jgi:hypothetical protein
MPNNTLNFPYKSYITAADVLENSGINLSERLLDDDFSDAVVREKAFLREIAGMIYDLILEAKGLPFTKKLMEQVDQDEELKDHLKIMQFYQAIYIFENGQPQSIAGLYDSNGVVLDIKELRGERNYSPKVISYLISMGILNSGLC